MKFREKDITEAFTKRLRLNSSHTIFAHNIYLYGKYESDIISVLNGRVYEYEVKTNIDDFMNEFRNKKQKHKLLQSSKNKINIPNYFYFVCPKDMIDKNIVHSKYGIIEFDKNGKFDYKKRARSLHEEKIKYDKLMKLTVSLSYKYWNPIHNLKIK